MKVWKYIIYAADEKEHPLDLSDNFISVGPYAIQGQRVYGPGLKPDMPVWDLIKTIASVPGVTYDVTHGGERTGYGHGWEELRFANPDGSLIYKVWHIDHCDGPGYSCSYSHGPWWAYGEYKGDAQPDPELMEAMAVKKRLAEKFNF